MFFSFDSITSCLVTENTCLQRAHHTSNNTFYTTLSALFNKQCLYLCIENKKNSHMRPTETCTANSHKVATLWFQGSPKVVKELSKTHKVVPNCFKVGSKLSQGGLQLVSKLFQSCPKIVLKLCPNSFMVISRLLSQSNFKFVPKLSRS